MGTLWIQSLLLSVILTGSVTLGQTDASTLYRGKYIGSLTARAHKVSGDVYAVDSKTLYIRNFVYSGSGPDAFFWVGFTEHPSPQGIIVPNEKGTKDVLGAYNMEDITLTLPGGLTLRDIKWFGVWCRAYEVNFGDLYIPADLDYPQPHVIGSLSGQHAVSSGPIVIIDSSTILVPDFTYDGQGPAVFFWVGKGKPGPDGVKLADETGSEAPLKKSDKKTMVLSLPPGLTIFDIDYLSLWCELYFVDFGHVKIPRNLNVPPSLRMLGVTPQTKLNCEVLQDEKAIEIRWAIAGESIVMQLVGRIDDGQYISFGLSGDESRSLMIGGDVVVAWIDKTTGKGNVHDYYLESKAQCSGRRGTCPDSRVQAETNNVRLLSATVVNGFTFLTFQRPLTAHDELDRTIYTNASQSVIWAVGPINQRGEASYHSKRNRDDLFIDFGRVPKWNCPAPEPEVPKPSTPLPPSQQQNQETKPGIFVQLTSEAKPVSVGVPTPPRPTAVKESNPGWKIPPINCFEPSDGVFYAQIGPTGGKRGYSSITGQVGWGIAWYINGLLVPEVTLIRGQTYTFVVEGGDNPEIPAKFHPFYISDDAEGGYQHKSEAERRKVKVFAGVGIDATGKSYPTGTGRLCQWQETNGLPADSFVSYGAYQRSLSLQCDAGGHPGIVHWKPDESTPDLVYYHCFTHRYLGWKIHIVDRCEGDESGEGQGVKDQELGESIAEERGTPRVPSGTKISPELSETVESASDPSTKPQQTEKEIPSGNSQLIGKQEFVQTYIPGPQPQPQHGPTFVQQQDPYLRPPQTLLIPQNGFVQVPAPASPQQLPPGLYPAQNFGSLHYPYEGQLVRKEGTPAPPFSEPYGQRVGDGYYSGPTRSPVVAHPRPAVLYASTVPPQLLSSVRLPSQLPESPLLAGGIVRDTRLRPQSRNLPKREQMQDLEQDVRMFLSKEDLEHGLKSLSIKDRSSVEIIRINDTTRLPFTLPVEMRNAAHKRLSSLSPAPIKYSGSGNHSPEPSFSPRPLNHQRYAQTVPRSNQLSPGGQQQSFRYAQAGVSQEGFTGLGSERLSQRLPVLPQQADPQRTLHQPQGPYGHRESSKLQVIPHEDVTMIYIKGTDDKGLQRELPSILHSLGNEGEREPARLQERRASDPRPQSRPNQHTAGEGKAKGQNNTDLHILTDIWSIINNQDGGGVKSAQQVGMTHSRPRPLTAVHTQGSGPYRHQKEVQTRTEKSISEAVMEILGNLGQ